MFIYRNYLLPEEVDFSLNVLPFISEDPIKVCFDDGSVLGWAIPESNPLFRLGGGHAI